MSNLSKLLNQKSYISINRFISKHRFLKKTYLFLRSNLITSYFYNFFLHKKFVRFFPDIICIDASTICNLNCPLSICKAIKKGYGLSKGFLKYSNFKLLLDEISPYIKGIFLSNGGEIFLNPEIFRIINYAESKNVEVSADSNLNNFNGDFAKKLVKSGMSGLNIVIDGASQETYSIYRKGGDFNKIIEHIELINKAKKKYNSKKPFLTWSFIIFGHNEHEIEKAKKLAKRLDMDFVTKLNALPNYSTPKNKKYTRDYYKKKYKEKYIDGCSQLRYQPIINWNGNMLGCCQRRNERLSFGNVFKEGFFNVYYGEKMSTMRKVIAKRKSKLTCKTCERIFLKKYKTK